MNLFIFYPETELLRRVAAKLRKKIEEGALIVHALFFLFDLVFISLKKSIFAITFLMKECLALFPIS